MYQGGVPAQCASSNGVGNTDAAISPDRKNVYTVSFNYDGNNTKGTIAVLDRDPDTGILTQNAGHPLLSRRQPSGQRVPEHRPDVEAGRRRGQSGWQERLRVRFDSLTVTEFKRDPATGELTLGQCYDDNPALPMRRGQGDGQARSHRRQPRQPQRLRRRQ